MGTDTRGLWYNKSDSARPGIALPWHPKTGPTCSGAADYKGFSEADAGVTPLNVYPAWSPARPPACKGFDCSCTYQQPALRLRHQQMGGGCRCRLARQRSTSSRRSTARASLLARTELSTTIGTTIAGQLLRRTSWRSTSTAVGCPRLSPRPLRASTRGRTGARSSL